MGNPREGRARPIGHTRRTATAACDLLLRGGTLVTPEGIVEAALAIRDGRILLKPGPVEAASALDVQGCYVVPGFVDIHFHGYNLFEFTAGRFHPETETFDDSAEAYDQGFAMLRRTLARFGVTGFYVASWAAPVDTLRRCFGHLARALGHTAAAGEAAGARLLGGLLEGSFINPAMAGAQNPAFVFEPSVEAFARIEDRGAIRLANVVPDYGEASLTLIRHLSSRGVVVGAGHTAATAAQVHRAADAGLRYFIHFLNGPTGGSYKPFDGGGAVEAGLEREDLFLELILDGCHVNPRYVRDVLARIGFDRAVAVTDAVYVAGSELREITIGGIQGRVSEDGSHLYVVGKPNTLCSSNLTMDRAFRNLLNWLTVEHPGIWTRRHACLSLEQALSAAAKLCSTNACRLTGLDRAGLGAIRDGAQADLAVLRVEGEPGRYTLVVEQTIVGGVPVV